MTAPELSEAEAAVVRLLQRTHPTHRQQRRRAVPPLHRLPPTRLGGVSVNASHLRITAPASAAPIPRDEATDQAREQFQAARDAYIDLLGTFGQHRLQWMLKSREKVTVPTLRATRDAAQRLAEQALAVVGALDACVDTCERAARS